MPVKGGEQGLTMLQARFCREIVADPSSAGRAAERAGYKPTCAPYAGSQLLKRPHIKAEIQRLQRGEAVKAERVGIDADYLTDKTVSILERCVAPETFDANPALRAIELLGRRIGYFEMDNKQRAGSRVTELPRNVQEALLAHLTASRERTIEGTHATEATDQARS